MARLYLNPSRDLGSRGSTGRPGTARSCGELQLEDVLSALRYLRRRADIDPEHITVAGCSLGGVEALLVAEQSPDIHRVVSFSPGAIMWRTNAPLRLRLLEAATHAQVPVFLLQAENDFNTAPTTELSAAMRERGLPVRAQIFAANGTTARQGHAFCGGGVAPPWGDAVLAFLEDEP